MSEDIITSIQKLKTENKQLKKNYDNIQKSINKLLNNNRILNDSCVKYMTEIAELTLKIIQLKREKTELEERLNYYTNECLKLINENKKNIEELVDNIVKELAKIK